MMRWLLRLLLLLLVGLPLVLAGLVFLALDNTPLVVSKVAFTPANIERAKRLLDRNDPRKMRQGAPRTIVIAQEDLDLAVNYIASRYARGSTSIVLQDGSATVRATFELPGNPFGRYANLDLALTETPYLPRVEQAHMGRIPLPAFVCNWLVKEGMARLQDHTDYSAAADVVKKVSVSDGLLKVVFAWNDKFAGQLKAALVPADDQVRWQVYQARLIELTSRPVRGRNLPLEELLPPMLQLAQQRAGGAGDKAAAENRALIVVLAFYVNGKGLAALVPAARDWPAPIQRVVTLAGRTDFPQHFLVSAALAASVGSPLSDAVGVYKEVDDSRGGSGFSFNDIAADRAGTRFGEMAAASAAGAAKLYRLAGRGLHEGDFFPEVKDLPEFMTEADFKRRYGGIGQPEYMKMVTEIERRIAVLPLYR